MSEQSSKTEPSEAQQVTLRELVHDDVVRVHELLSDERVIRHMLFSVFTQQEALEFVYSAVASASARPRRNVALGITTLGTDTIVGLSGLQISPENEQGEAWFLLDPPYWGKGFTTEAARLLLMTGFIDFSLHRIWANCLPENPGSVRVLEKIGMRREGLLKKNLRIHGTWCDSYLYALLKEEWEAALAPSADTDVTSENDALHD
jgi:RimJ/RimL family protein N-acetyltransferase